MPAAVPLIVPNSASAEPVILRFPALYVPPAEAPAAHRTSNPVRSRNNKRKSAPGQQELWSGVDPEVLAVAEQIVGDFRDPVIPEAQRD